MSEYFFDSSGLVKRYINEFDSRWVENVVDLDSGNMILVTEIGIVEINAAIARRSCGGALTSSEANTAYRKIEHDVADEYSLVGITSLILGDAVNIARTYFLRGYDAVQLAAALNINQNNLTLGAPSITFVSADRELNAAAQAAGLPVENPNDHP